MNDVTAILTAIEHGEQHAAAQLLPLVYEDLRRLAVHRLADETPDQTLEPTALVHEAYLRLVGDKVSSDWNGRGHFFAAAAEAMRRILVENARRKHSLKRGGHLSRVQLDKAEMSSPQTNEDLIELDEALIDFARSDPAAAQLVQLRYFGGLSMQEAARYMDMPLRSAERLWTYARAWLHQRIKGNKKDSVE